MSSRSHPEQEKRERENDGAAEPERPAGPPSPQGSGAPVGELNAPALAEEIRKLQAAKQELTDTLMRRQADFENYRKRVEKERHHDRHRGVEALIEHLLPVLDAFDRAFAESADPGYVEYRKGFQLIRRQLWETLAKQGLVRIESVGQQFNPHFHHAIERVETSEHADGIVIAELQPGYKFHDRILRPAMVRVASAPEPESVNRSRNSN